MPTATALKAAMPNYEGDVNDRAASAGGDVPPGELLAGNQGCTEVNAQSGFIPDLTNIEDALNAYTNAGLPYRVGGARNRISISGALRGLA
ncbi:hypothetical protein GCM10007913_25760 [Devosia yakushimensis]|uniref:Uncharacterized protein n=1 Tax=Devosia yakushimensis TaxID=470028 RepID=A0ABQ5UHJ8_9HYPH|nr:hypothetical protein GCM10007913_25760 [Devosia yakushimensis]